ncbi:MAG: CoA transferase [Chloroflexi bacterium]|nr:CoA transferase [Chloroflexota bacterium]
MPQGALDDLFVVDLSQGAGGAYCTRLLADLGATVVLVEPPEGNALRRAGPFPGDVPHSEKSGLFLYFCANKYGVSLDLSTREGKRRLLGLVERADLLVEDFPPGTMEKLGLGYKALRRRNPRLVHTSITPFGQTGPWRDYVSSEIVEWAVGGWMYSVGEKGREPLFLAGQQGPIHGGIQGAIGGLAALYWARKTGEGQYVDVSDFESVQVGHSMLAAGWSHEGKVVTRTTHDFIRCKDGWFVIMAFRFDHNLFVLMERPELMEDPRFATREAWLQNREALLDVMREWALEHTKDEIYHNAQELRLATTPLYTFPELLHHAQLLERDWFLEIDHPAAGRLTYPGFPYKMSVTPPAVRRPAPLLGQHNEEVFGPRASVIPAVLVPAGGAMPQTNGRRGRGKHLPLEGVRIIEVTANWAAPLGGRFLADLGAEVYKIEPPERPATRMGRFPGQQVWKYHWNRAAYFDQVNRNKWGVTLDISQPEGRDAFLKMARQADVVLENNSVRVFHNLKIDWDVLKEVNPRLSLVSISGFGQTGPERDYSAYGSNIEASCGLASVTGYLGEEQAYRLGSFYADPNTAFHATVAILAALRYHDRTGKGQFIDLSLHENGILFMAESFMECIMSGKQPPILGNRHRTYAPQGCYRSLGDDMWVVVSCRDDGEWQRMCQAMGHSEWAERPEFATVEGRRTHHDEIDKLISSWTAEHDHNEATRVLQAARVPAAPVLANWEMLSNLHLHARDFWVVTPHPEMGAWPYPAFAWQLSRTPASVRMSAPMFGQHNRYVYRDVFGLTEEEFQALYETKAVVDKPPADLPPPMILP